MGLVIANRNVSNELGRNTNRYSTNAAPNGAIAGNGSTARYGLLDATAARNGLIDATDERIGLLDVIAARYGLINALAARYGLLDAATRYGSSSRHDADVTLGNPVEYYSYQYHYNCLVNSITSYGFPWNHVEPPRKTM